MEAAGHRRQPLRSDRDRGSLAGRDPDPLGAACAGAGGSRAVNGAPLVARPRPLPARLLMPALVAGALLPSAGAEGRPIPNLYPGGPPSAAADTVVIELP